MTDKELKNIVAILGEQIAAISREIKDIQAETAKQIRAVNKQLGGLGNKFGSFTEGFINPS